MTGSSKPRTPRMAQPVGKPQEMPPPSEQAEGPRPAPKMVEPERIPSLVEQPERWVPDTADVGVPAPSSEATGLAEVASTGGATVEEPVPVAYPTTMKEVFARIDPAWAGFHAAASAWPSERMDEHLSEGGWTRKQMLAHISAWHDQTHDRLGDMILSGQPSERTVDEEPFNARVARQAIGRTAGEVLKEMEMTFNRLRRQLGRLTDQQLVADDGWAAGIIAGNTYEHYADHAADVYQPPLDPNARRR